MKIIVNKKILFRFAYHIKSNQLAKPTNQSTNHLRIPSFIIHQKILYLPMVIK